MVGACLAPYRRCQCRRHVEIKRCNGIAFLDSTTTIRPATKQDARSVAELIELAGEGIPGYYWQLSAVKGRQAIDVGTERALREDANFSYRNAVLAEHQDTVVAMLLGYKLPDSVENIDLTEYPPVVRPFVELELLVPGSFYINALAVYPLFQGRGFGSRLLAFADSLAIDVGCGQLSIQVFEQNSGAVQLYLRHGFQIIARRPVVKHISHSYDTDVVLLVKPVQPL